LTAFLRSFYKYKFKTSLEVFSELFLTMLQEELGRFLNRFLVALWQSHKRVSIMADTRTAIQRFQLACEKELIVFIYGPKSGSPGIVIFLYGEKIAVASPTENEVEFNGSYQVNATYRGNDDLVAEINITSDGKDYILRVSTNNHECCPAGAFRYLPFDEAQ
jgi:hypothetical protein